MMRENPIDPRQQAPQEMPLVPRWEFFRTLAGPGETAYPDAGDSPTVYYAQQLKNVTFTETPGAQSLSYDTTTKYSYVYNLSTADYVESGSVLLCQRKNGRWWTVDKVRDGLLAVVIDATVYGLSTATGTTLWTYDLTDLDETYIRGMQCRFDSTGRLWGSALAWDDAGTDTTPRVIVYRLSNAGSLQWSTDLGAAVNTSMTYNGILTNLTADRSFLFSGDVRHLADGRCCVAHAKLANAGEILTFFASDGTLDEQMSQSNTTYSVSNSLSVTQHISTPFGLSGMTQDANGALWLATLTSSSGSRTILGLTLDGDWFSAGAYDDPLAAEEFATVQQTGGIAAHPTSAYLYTMHDTQLASAIHDSGSAEMSLRLTDIGSEEVDLAAHSSLDDFATLAGVNLGVGSIAHIVQQVAYRDGVVAAASGGWRGFDTDTAALLGTYGRHIMAASGMTPQAAILDSVDDINSGDSVGASRVCFERIDNDSGGIFWGRGVFRGSGTTAEVPLVQRTNRTGGIVWSALSMSGTPKIAVTGLDAY